MELPQETKNRTTEWSSSSISVYLSKENRTTNVKNYMHLYVYCSIIYKIWARYGSNLIVHPIDE